MRIGRGIGRGNDRLGREGRREEEYWKERNRRGEEIDEKGREDIGKRRKEEYSIRYNI